LGLTDYGRASVVTRRLAETQPVIIEAESFDEDYNAPKRPALLTPADLAPPIIYVLTGEEPEGAFIGVG
jgi:hypothetical protein